MLLIFHDFYSHTYSFLIFLDIARLIAYIVSYKTLQYYSFILIWAGILLKFIVIYSVWHAHFILIISDAIAINTAEIETIIEAKNCFVEDF